jgi:hypothetical protein
MRICHLDVFRSVKTSARSEFPFAFGRQASHQATEMFGRDTSAGAWHSSDGQTSEP